MALSKGTVDKLSAIKLLLNEAKQKVDSSGTQRAFAVLYTHDALDWMFQVIFELPEFGGKKSPKMFLLNYASEINKKEKGLINLGNVSKINTLRVNFKHDFVFPDPELAKDLVSWAENQINTICQRFFHFSLEEVDLLTAIDNQEIKKKINEADDFFSKGKINDAFCSLSIAFEMAKYLLQDNLEVITGKRPIFRTNLDFSNAFFLHLDQVGRDFARAWDQIVDSVEYLVDMSFINSLGVSINDYFQFQSTAPAASRMMDGTYRCDITPKIESRIKKSLYSKSRDFVIEVALKVESKK